MDELIQKLHNFTVQQDDFLKDELCLILSNCTKLAKKNINPETADSALNVCLIIYKKETYPFVIYLLDKLIVVLANTKQLNYNVLCCNEQLDASFHRYLLKSIVRKLKKDGFSLEDSDIISYMLKFISLFMSTITDCFDPDKRAIILQLLKIYKYLDQKMDLHLVTLLASFYNKILQHMLDMALPETAANWKFISLLMKYVVQIEQKFKNNDSVFMCHQFLVLFLDRVEQLSLCGSNLCGLLLPNNVDQRFCIDEQSGRRLILSLLGLIYLDQNQIHEKGNYLKDSSEILSIRQNISVRCKVDFTHETFFVSVDFT